MAGPTSEWLRSRYVSCCRLGRSFTKAVMIHDLQVRTHFQAHFLASTKTHHGSNGRPHVGVAEVQVCELLQAGQQPEQALLLMLAPSLPAHHQLHSLSKVDQLQTRLDHVLWNECSL